MGLRVSQAPSVHRALSSSLLSSGSVSSFLGTGCDTTMSPRSMSSASLLPEGCNSSFNSYGDRYAMERQSVRELRKAAQEAAAHPLPGQGAQEMTAPPLPGHGQHAAERLADEPWADDVSESFSAGGFVSGASLGASPPGSEDTLRAPATRIDHPPRYAATEGAGHPQVASESPEGPTRRDVRRPSRQAEGGDEPRTGGGTAGAAGGLAEELRFLREENARLLGRQALLEEMAAKAWADHTAEVAHEATGAVSSSIGRASGDVAAGARGPLDDVDDVPPASPPAPARVSSHWARPLRPTGALGASRAIRSAIPPKNGGGYRGGVGGTEDSGSAGAVGCCGWRRNRRRRRRPHRRYDCHAACRSHGHELVGCNVGAARHPCSPQRLLPGIGLARMTGRGRRRRRRWFESASLQPRLHRSRLEWCDFVCFLQKQNPMQPPPMW